jgi:hypothetical protein
MQQAGRLKIGRNRNEATLAQVDQLAPCLDPRSPARTSTSRLRV